MNVATGDVVEIEIDGGVGTGNVQQLVHTGADVLVAGNSVFGAKDPAQAIVDLSA